MKMYILKLKIWNQHWSRPTEKNANKRKNGCSISNFNILKHTDLKYGLSRLYIKINSYNEIPLLYYSRFSNFVGV
jgi:hypothetical protein